MKCPNCNKENAEVFSGLIKGNPMPNTLANFCGQCGTDLRPYHEKIIKKSNLMPLPID